MALESTILDGLRKKEKNNISVNLDSIQTMKEVSSNQLAKNIKDINFLLDAMVNISKAKENWTVSQILEEINKGSKKYKKLLKSFLRSGLGISKATMKDLFNIDKEISKSQLVSLSENINEMAGNSSIEVYTIDSIINMEDSTYVDMAILDELNDAEFEEIAQEMDDWKFSEVDPSENEDLQDSMLRDWSFATKKPKHDKKRLRSMMLKVRAGYSHGKRGYWTLPTNSSGKIDMKYYVPRDKTPFFNKLNNKDKKSRKARLKKLKVALMKARGKNHSSKAEKYWKMSMEKGGYMKKKDKSSDSKSPKKTISKRSVKEV